MIIRAAVLVALLCVGCSGGGSASSAGPFYPFLGFTNATTVDLTVRVNDGTAERKVAANAALELPVSELTAPPWHAQVLSPSGRVVLTLDVPAADVWRAYPTGEGQEIRSDAAFAWLSCGRIDLFYGPPALGPPAPSPAGSSGDCD